MLTAFRTANNRLKLILSIFIGMKGLMLISGFVFCMLHLQAQQLQLPPLFGEPGNKIPVVKGSEKPEEVVKKYVFIKAVQSKKKVFAGEPVLVDYKLFTAVNNKAKILKQPYFSGRSVTELDDDLPRIDTIINDIHYTVFNLRKVQLIPLQPGKIELGNFYVENVIPILHADGSGVENFSITLQNQPLYLDVISLPPNKKPSDFRNILGDFTIQASVEPRKAEVGDNINLQIAIGGRGNITGVQMPDIKWPEGLEHFEPLDSQQIDLDEFPLSGVKTFTIPFIANKTGEFVIPEISYSFFDTENNAYKTVSTGEIPFSVDVAGDKKPLPAVVTGDVTNRKYLWIVGALAIPVFVFLVVTARRKSATEPVGGSSNENDSSGGTNAEEDHSFDILSALNTLGAATRKGDFLIKTKAFLITVLQDKLKTKETSEIEILQLLQSHEEMSGFYKEADRIFSSCNRQLYAPSGDEDEAEQIYFEVTSVVKRMYNI